MNYPSADQIIKLNILALDLIRVKKKDASKVLSFSKISGVLLDCRAHKGDVYGKAVVLLFGLIKAHAFASGNRRTAFLAMKLFLKNNNAKIGITDDPSNAIVMRGIREGHYAEAEIREWIISGKIREFKR